MLVLALLAGCGSDFISNVEAEPTDVQTVVRVSFDTKDEATAVVKFGPGDLRYETPPTEKGTHHEVLLVGLPGLTESHYQIVADADGDTEEDEERTVKTGTVPTNFKEITVTGEGHDQFMVGPLLGSDFTGITMLDPEGRYVWNYLDEHEGLLSYRARLNRNGSGFVYNLAWISGTPVEQGTGLLEVPFDGSAETFIPIDYLAHDFVQHEDGTYAALVFADGPGCKAGSSDLGNKLVEVAPDGTQSEIWSSWDCFDPCVDLSQNKEEVGWTFTNGLDYDEATESYLVSMRHFSSIASVSRATGQCNWVFGTVGTDFHPPKDATFQNQHQFELVDDHLLVFDNDGGGNHSRVLEFAFDPVGKTADLVWNYDTGVYTPVFGDVQRLGNGDTLITTSFAGQVDRVTSAKEVPWRANTASGNVLMFEEHYSSPYAPDSAPD